MRYYACLVLSILTLGFSISAFAYAGAQSSTASRNFGHGFDVSVTNHYDHEDDLSDLQKENLKQLNPYQEKKLLDTVSEGRKKTFCSDPQRTEQEQKSIELMCRMSDKVLDMNEEFKKVFPDF